MRAQKMYIETSVFNFLFADDAPDKRDDTLLLFKEIHDGRFLPFTSDYVLNELEQAPEPKQSRMMALVREYSVTLLSASEEIEHLADLYVAAGIIPRKYVSDALHIAAATVNDMDLIVSFNFKHIVKLKTVTMTEAVNIREGYRRIGIYCPTEVIDNDE